MELEISKVTKNQTMKKKLLQSKGFTLVELLIVIALIGILSVAVLATINPIEQTNKARDAQFRNDAAEVLSADERYYASQNAYPWNNSSVGVTVGTGIAVGLSSTDPIFGVESIGSTGALIIASELKSSFASKAPFLASPVPIDRMYLYHNGSDSNYVCYIPKANANRKVGGVPNPALHCLTMGNTPTFLQINQGSCAAGVLNWSGTDLLPSATVANMLCVPQ